MLAANRQTSRLLASGFALVLAACVQRVPVIDETSTPPLDEAGYRADAERGSVVYRIAPLESYALVRVGRAGAMKSLGHDHAVASEDIQGFVELGAGASESRADIVVPLRDLVVDKAEYREQLGLDTDPSESDIAGTYANMLKVLEPALHPWVAVHARVASMDNESATLGLSMTMHGTTVEFLVPVTLEIDATRLRVSGALSITHSEFGLAPFQAAGGLLRVADELEIVFELVGYVLAAP